PQAAVPPRPRSDWREKSNFDDLGSLEINVRQPEAAADQPAISENGAHLAWVGGSGHVEVLGLLTKKQIAHATSHQIGLVAVLAQPPDDFERVRIQERGRNFGRCRRELLARSLRGWRMCCSPFRVHPTRVFQELATSSRSPYKSAFPF